MDKKPESYKYKIGDFVRIKDIDNLTPRVSRFLTFGMRDYAGTEACIISVEYDDVEEMYIYRLDIDSGKHFWIEEMFTPLFARKTSSANCGVSAKQEHYQNSALQPIQVMQRIMSKEQFYGFLMGNFIKYSMRMSHKKSESVEKEKEKARQYAYWAELAKKDVIIDPIEHSVPPEFEYKGL